MKAEDDLRSALLVVAAIFGAVSLLVILILWPVLMEWWGQ